MVLYARDCSCTHLEANGEALGAVGTLLTVLQVGVEPLGFVTFSPCHVVSGEESARLLNGHHRQAGLVVFIHLRGGEGRRGEGGGLEERGGGERYVH